MTKDTYYDMCEQLGSTPLEDEVPVEIGDLPIEAVQAWQVYDKLPAMIDSFSGSYLGKHIEHTPVMLDLMDISIDRLVLFYIINLFDKIEKEQVSIRRKQDESTKKKG
jgi:hypothetical protein